jgi:hypothetical protein
MKTFTLPVFVVKRLSWLELSALPLVSVTLPVVAVKRRSRPELPALPLVSVTLPFDAQAQHKSTIAVSIKMVPFSRQMIFFLFFIANPFVTIQS